MSRPGEAARAAALHLVDAVLLRAQPLDDALQRALQPGKRLAGLAERDRAFARLLVATVLRRLGQIDAAIDACLDRPLKGGALGIRQTLRLGAAQILFLETPPHAAVDAAVRQARRRPAFTGLVNAVLRRLAREGVAILAGQDAERLNCPDWLWDSWVGAYGEAATRQSVALLVQDPALDISVKEAPEIWAKRLDATMLPTKSLRRAGGGVVESLPGFAQGAWWVQDAAAALPARLLGQVAGKSVLDLCAAPGGKTLGLAAAGARVTALDLSADRLARVQDNLDRTGLTAELVAADAREWRPAAPFELILLDAPCSATGTIRRHPDIWRLKTAGDVHRMAALQKELLAAAVTMLAPGGRLVFATCSLQPEEGDELIAEFLADHPKAGRESVVPAEVFELAQLITPAGDLRTLPCHLQVHGGLDGFYASRLQIRSDE